MGTGTVKWFNDARGSASSPPTPAARICLRTSQRSKARATRACRENQKVSFDTTTGPKGDQASNIESLD